MTSRNVGIILMQAKSVFVLYSPKVLVTTYELEVDIEHP
jgi:hypothetical protein